MEFQKDRDRIYLEDHSGKLLAEVTFPEVIPGVVQIDHTYVDESLRGQGVAGQLMEQAVRQIREHGWRAVPVCSYAVSWFQKHPDWRELLG